MQLLIGPLHDSVMWHKISHAGLHVMQWNIQNKAIHTHQAWLLFILDVPLINLHPGMADIVLCDQVVQRAYWYNELFQFSAKQGCINHVNYLYLVSLLIREINLSNFRVIQREHILERNSNDDDNWISLEKDWHPCTVQFNSEYIWFFVASSTTFICTLKDHNNYVYHYDS